MLVLINGPPPPESAGCLGQLVSPRSRNRVGPGCRWAADNDTFAAWDEGRFLTMLNRLDGVSGCLWVAAPDVVGDHAATLARFRDWWYEIAGRGFPVAFVGQDGAESGYVPWEAFDCLFLGGSTQWKLSAAAAELAAEARARGKWLHCGRVNTRRRLRIARALGCDSTDGSGWARYRDHYLRRDVPLVRELTAQGRLF